VNRPAGLLLAAGAGRRFGEPKALAHGGQWLRGALAALLEGECVDVHVVLGARAADAAALLPDGVTAVVAEDWADGMSASLRAGLEALRAREWRCLPGHTSPLTTCPQAALIHLVDLPDVGADVVRRLVELARPDVVARATYEGRPGHPVLLGRDHWAEVARRISGDQGAKDWLSARPDLRLVECGDLATGRDRDTPDTRFA
jgi:CTP:molybdopterin cytidylyltransferase MocA